MKTSVRDYFVFSKKERNGAVVLVVLSSVILFAPKYWLSRSADKDLPDMVQLRSLSASLKTPGDAARSDGATISNNDQGGDNGRGNINEQGNYTDRGSAYDGGGDNSQSNGYAARDGNASYAGAAVRRRLFRFDPNTISAMQWMELGLSERTTKTVMHYREKGGKFRSPDDLQKIWGMPADLARTLMTLVNIGQPKNAYPKFDRYPSRSFSDNRQYSNGGAQSHQRFSNSFNSPVYPPRDSSKRWTRYEPRPITKVDVNTADTTAFIALPGIGSKLAQRIITFREKLGGFYSVEQVGETFGLSDSTFQLIRPSLVLGPVEVKRLDINIATVDELRQHPYVRWALANAIVKYREAHGRFNSVDDLQTVSILNPEIFSKLRAYLTN